MNYWEFMLKLFYLTSLFRIVANGWKRKFYPLGSNDLAEIGSAYTDSTVGEEPSVGGVFITTSPSHSIKSGANAHLSV